MPIIASEIKIKTSTSGVGLGGAITGTDMPSGIFDTVSGAESAAGDVEYRCVYVKNEDPSLTLEGAKIWLSANDSGQINIGLGTSAINGTEQTVADEDTAPAGVTFSAAANEGAALSIGSIPAGQHKAVWLRRTVAAATPAQAVSFELTVKGDTAA